MELISGWKYCPTRLRRASQRGLCFFTVFMLGFCMASAQPGFLSLNCGSVQNETDATGLIWVTDTGYIPTGYSSGPLASGSTFRFFNDSRKRNCYSLPVQLATTYLVRASFLYSNYSELYGNVSFDLTLNATYWTTVEVSAVIDSSAENPGVDTVLRKEAIFQSNGSRVDVCLVRGSGVPFISGLVLRELADNMYVDVQRGMVLVTQWRWNADYCCIDETRYPDDPFDRIWTTTSGLGTVTANTTLLNTSTTDINQPPAAIMSRAWEWSRTTPSASFYGTITDLSGQYYTAAYFQEVDATALFTPSRGSRFLAVSLNGEHLQNVSVTASLKAVVSLFELPAQGGAHANLSVAKIATWGLGPLMNGWEFFSVCIVDPSNTTPVDVLGLDTLRKFLGPPLQEWTGDPCFPEPWEWVTCSSASPSRITRIQLSNMQLQGSLPTNFTGVLTELTDFWVDGNILSGSLPDFGSMSQLQTLHFQNNSFSGDIPTTLGGLPVLHELFVQNNNFSGKIPQILLDRAKNRLQNFTFSYAANPFLGMPGGSNPKSSFLNRGSNSSLKLWLVAAGGVLALIATLGCVLLFFCCGKSRRRAKEVESSVSAFDQEMARAFTLQQVKEVTHNFAKKLGEGSYGPVYYGKLPDGSEVAVKVKHDHSRQGTSEFINEVVLLSRVHHKYLVSLIGYCEESQHQILIYAYMHHGTLTDHLHGDLNEKNFLSWRARLDIALNAAQGLEYLHTVCNPAIIHRDVKPSNILLDANFVAKVADFGTSKSAPPGSQTSFSTAVKGTFGYLDPEYLSGWRLTEKSDVYSFGVVLLELLTGRIPTAVIRFKDGSEGNFMTWTRMAQRNGNIHAIVDPNLGNQFNTEAVWKVAELAWASTEPVGSSRPGMGEIVRGLLEAIQLETSDYIDVTSEPSFSAEFYVNPNPFSSSIPLKAPTDYSSLSTSDQYQPS